MLTTTFKARNNFVPSYLAFALGLYDRCTLGLPGSPDLGWKNFKWKTVGIRSFGAAGRRLWNSLPPSVLTDALACTDPTPGIVSALLRCYLFAAYYDGLSSEFSSLPATTVVGCIRKRTDSSRGSVLSMKLLFSK